MIALFGGPLSRVERVALGVGLLLSAALMSQVRDATPDSAYVWLHVARHLALQAPPKLNRPGVVLDLLGLLVVRDCNDQHRRLLAGNRGRWIIGHPTHSVQAIAWIGNQTTVGHAEDRRRGLDDEAAEEAIWASRCPPP